MTDVVSYRLSGGVAQITMDDGAANALSFVVLAGLSAALDRAAADGVPVVLVGRRDRFSAGFDPGVLLARPDRAAGLVRTGFELAQRLMSFPLPVVTACTGDAEGMGLFLVLSSDFRIGGAVPDHRLVAREAAIGLTMRRAAIVICQHRVDRRHYERVVLLAEPFAPEEAVAAGLLDRVVDPDDVVDAAREKARELAELERGVYAVTKLRVRRQLLSTLGLAIDQDAKQLRQPVVTTVA